MNKIISFFKESQTARFLIPAGIALIVFGVIMLLINLKNQNYVKVEAVVTKVELVEESHIDVDGNHVDATYRVFVKYNVKNRAYIEELGELSGYKKGQKITIYYNPDNPKQITQTKSLIIPSVIIVGGIAALVGGIVSGVKAIKKQEI